MSKRKSNIQEMLNRAIKTNAYEDVWMDSPQMTARFYSRRLYRHHQVPKFKKTLYRRRP